MEKSLAIKEDTATVSIEDVKKFIAPNATDKELFMFMGIARSYGLNPLKREIHFVKYGSNPASIITGYEIYLKRAERTGKLDGWKCWIEKDQIGEKAIIEIKRKDQSSPFRWEVYRNEFDKQQSTWKTMPTFMLKKVAIAQGFRLAFPDDLGGMPYIPEEMPQDKGGGASETLPTSNVDVVEASVEDVKDFEPEQEAAPELPQEPGSETVIVVIGSLKAKEGAKNGKKYKRYIITDTNGVDYFTFDSNIAAEAKTAHEVGASANITYAVSQYGNDIIKLIPNIPEE